MKKILLAFFFFILLWPQISMANVRLPKIFGDNMVLQRDQLIPVWGWADPDESIQVSFHLQTKKTQADKSGKWMVKLDPEKAGGPFTLDIRGETEVHFADVWVGEVWLCSGQSNMELEMKYLLDLNQNVKQSYPLIRQLKVPACVSKNLQEDISGNPSWITAEFSHIDDFTAVGYFFALKLHKSLGVPIGLVNASRGATTIEPWISEFAFRSEADLAFVIDGIKEVSIQDLEYDKQYIYPTLLFNTMINPLIPYAFKGVIWYQGEGNVGNAEGYRKTFPLLISDWRKKWDMGDFPFYFVQLSSFDATKANPDSNFDFKNAWAELREAQSSVLQMANTGMAVTTDIGDPDNIHPQNKKDVGNRLAAIALSKTYNRNIVHSGPVFKKYIIKKNKIVIHFDEVNSGLYSINNGNDIYGFEVAGSDGEFMPVNAKISDETIVIHWERKTKPIAVRYSWTDDAGKSNLFNKEGFPAAPFRKTIVTN